MTKKMLLFCPSWSCTIICIIFTSLCKKLVKLTWVFSRSFSMPCASFSMLGGPGGTGCDVPVHGCWVCRDIYCGCCVWLCQRVYGICNVFDHLICWLGIDYNVCISHIVQWCLVWGLLVVCVKFLGLFRCQCMYDECWIYVLQSLIL